MPYANCMYFPEVYEYLKRVMKISIKLPVGYVIEMIFETPAVWFTCENFKCVQLKG